jgi:hypothetical protein
VYETENNLNITSGIPEEPAICNIRPSTLKMRAGDSSGVSVHIYQIQCITTQKINYLYSHSYGNVKKM